MGLKWNCLEHLTALSIGCVGMVLGDVGTAAAGAVGGAALLGAWREVKARNGLESGKLLDRVRRDAREGFEEWARGRWVDEADIEAADYLMASDLLECFPDIEALGAAALDTRTYPKAVASLVLDRLADRHALFGTPPAAGTSQAARDFALTTIEAAVRSAIGDSDYVQKLLPHMVLAIAQAMKTLSDNASAILQQLSSTRSELAGLLEQVPDLALRREIMQLVGSNPQASLTEIAGDVARFARNYRNLLDELAALKADDNELRGAEQAAEEALLNGDLPRARRFLGEAVRTAEKRATAPVRDLARVLERQARTALLQREWRSADAAWSKAEAVLAPFDESESRWANMNAARALFEFGFDHGEKGAMVASVDRLTRMAEFAAESGDFKSAAGYWCNIGSAFSTLYDRMDSGDPTYPRPAPWKRAAPP